MPHHPYFRRRKMFKSTIFVCFSNLLWFKSETDPEISLKSLGIIALMPSNLAQYDITQSKNLGLTIQETLEVPKTSLTRKPFLEHSLFW